MRNVFASVLTIAMLATASLIALDLAALSRSGMPYAASNVPAIADTNRTSLIEVFYDAANTILAGGDSTLLATVVSSRAEIHAGTGTATLGQAGVISHLDELRQRRQVSLRPARLIGGGSDVAVVVEARAPAANARTGAVAPPPLLWQTIDRFHIEAGMIAGYWPGAIDLPPSPPLPNVTMRATPGDAAVSLTRLEMIPATGELSLYVPFPHLLLVESGTLAVPRKHGFLFARAGESAFITLHAEPGAEDLLVRSGDALFLPENIPHSMRNAGESTSSVLSLVVAPRAELYSQLRAMSNDLLTVMGMHDPWRIGRRVTWDNHAVSETLFVSILPDAGPRARWTAISGKPILIEPGQRLPALPPGHPRLAIVRAGSSSVTGLDRLADATPSPGPTAPPSTPESGRLYWAGDAFSIESGEAPAFENQGAMRADVLVIELQPVDSGNYASPTSNSAALPDESTSAPLK